MLKLTAKSKNEELFYKIKDRNLIANEFKVHKCCYNDFTKPSVTDKENIEPQSNNYEKGDFDKVVAFIKQEVIDKNSVTTLSTLHEMYGLGVGDSRYKSRLKERIEKEFGDELVILTDSAGSKKKIELVLNSICVEPSGQINRPEFLVRKAGELLRNEILDKFKDNKMENWPPSIASKCR